LFNGPEKIGLPQEQLSSFRIVNVWRLWNGLPDDVILSPTLNSFNAGINHHWRSVFWLCHCLL